MINMELELARDLKGDENVSQAKILPRLNMAMPRPALDKIEIDPWTMEGILMFHLVDDNNLYHA